VNRGEDQLEMDFPSRPPVSCEPPTELLPALGLQKGQVMRSSRDLLILVDHAETVQNLKPDIRALSKLEMGIGGVIVTAAGDSDVDYVCRYFLPSVGINEDPVTGSIQCTLVPFWAERTGKPTFRVRQLSPRGGRMRCKLAGDRVRIAGEAKLYRHGTIHV
jgi:predicted PhzF superfamily epimerase YddE/YHI9